MMCAPSFSGKTTLANITAALLDCAYISLDEINPRRGIYKGFEASEEEWAKTHQLALARLERLLAAGRFPVVVDDLTGRKD